MSVCALMASPLAKGLFHRAIVHSGSAPGNLHDRAAMESLGVEFAKRLGADDLKAMRAKSADELLAAAKKNTGRVGEGTLDNLCIDGYVLPESLHKIFAAGRQHNVPLIAGTTKDEDRLFLAGVQAVVQAMAAIQPQTFSYEFRRTPDYAAAKKLGCFHGVELPYLFRYFPPLLKFNADDERLSDLMIGYWSRFARTRRPQRRRCAGVAGLHGDHSARATARCRNPNDSTGQQTGRGGSGEVHHAAVSAGGGQRRHRGGHARAAPGALERRDGTSRPPSAARRTSAPFATGT